MYQIPSLPLRQEIETKAVLKQVAQAHRRLAELKGAVTSIPNTSILINTLSLQEAKDSSAVESIITTHDELYKAELSFTGSMTPATKEVRSYADALLHGFDKVKRHSLLTCNDMIEIYQRIKRNSAGFRVTPGTTLKNDLTGEIVYQPPQSYDEIVSYMNNLERFINDSEMCDWDPLVKMSVIHHQLESIHPFSDGNGRTGRVINILYLVLQDLLDLPVLYLSRYIIKNKSEYYRLLQAVRNNQAEWENWVLFMLKGVEETSIETIVLIKSIKELMMAYKQKIRGELTKIYSQDLLNNLFKHPYTKIDFICQDLQVTRPTAVSYLNQLVDAGILSKMKMGRDNFYLNVRLFNLLMNAFHSEDSAKGGEDGQIATIN
ncbi:MAG: Fic family protein [Bacteroidaceae bacterium]|nr:Fic family protein [Bacteroidaceae bacterium]